MKGAVSPDSTRSTRRGRSIAVAAAAVLLIGCNNGTRCSEYTYTDLVWKHVADLHAQNPELPKPRPEITAFATTSGRTTVACPSQAGTVAVEFTVQGNDMAIRAEFGAPSAAAPGGTATGRVDLWSDPSHGHPDLTAQYGKASPRKPVSFVLEIDCSRASTVVSVKALHPVATGTTRTITLRRA